MRAPREARLGEDVEEVEAKLSVAAIDQRRPEKTGIIRAPWLGFRAPFSCAGENRESTRVREEKQRRDRGEELGGDLIHAGAATGGERFELGQPARVQRPPWSLQEEEDDRGFARNPLSFSFSFYFGPFLFLFFCSYFLFQILIRI